MSANETPRGKCVICGKPKDERFKPFCSKRCADVDLNRWFSGAYAIPAEEESPGEQDSPGDRKD